MERYVSVRIILVKAFRCTCIFILFNWYELSFLFILHCI